jgi:hypothetical protein
MEFKEKPSATGTSVGLGVGADVGELVESLQALRAAAIIRAQAIVVIASFSKNPV